MLEIIYTLWFTSNEHAYHSILSQTEFFYFLNLGLAASFSPLPADLFINQDS